MKKTVLYLTILLSAFLCSSCNNLEKVLAPHNIGEVITKPSDFGNQPFYVSGTVDGSGVSLLGYKSYSLRDDYGHSIRVKTERSILPASGEKLTIRARIDEGFSLGGISDKVLVELPE